MRVLHLISSGGYYGAESMMLSLCVQLEMLGCEPVVGVFRNFHKPNVDTVCHAKRLGLQNVAFDCRHRLDLDTRKAIRDFAVGKQIDILHTHGYKADLYGYAAMRKGPAALVATCHGLTGAIQGSSFPLQLYGLLDKTVLKSFDIVSAVSEPIGNSLLKLGVPQSLLTVIPNGVDVDAFASSSPSFRSELRAGDRPIIGMVGRMVTAKGPDVFLKAAVGVLREFPETLFVLVGDGPDLERLAKVVRSLAVESSVMFTGQRNDLPSIYASLDVLVLPSFHEGTPMVVLEAMAAGKAVIATEVGGIPSLVVPGETGVLIKPGDSESLRIAISSLLTNPGLQRRLGEGAQQLVRDKFSSRIMAESYVGAYRRALARVELKRAPNRKGKA